MTLSSPSLLTELRSALTSGVRAMLHADGQTQHIPEPPPLALTLIQVRAMLHADSAEAEALLGEAATTRQRAAEVPQTPFPPTPGPTSNPKPYVDASLYPYC